MDVVRRLETSETESESESKRAAQSCCQAVKHKAQIKAPTTPLHLLPFASCLIVVLCPAQHNKNEAIWDS